VKIKKVLLLSVCLSARLCLLLCSNQTACINLYYTSPSFTNETIKIDPETLCKAASYAIDYYFVTDEENKLISSKLLENDFISSKSTKQTLDFIIQTIAEDEKNQSKKPRILDPKFLEKHFIFIKWCGDKQGAKQHNVSVENEKIRLTHYAVFSSNGSHEKSEQFPCALYEIISEEFDTSKRFDYTKQDVIDGALEDKEFKRHVNPLIWLPRQGLEDALLQGSVVAIMPNGQEKIFNVDKNNGIDYDRTIKDSWKQRRYWYFKEIGNTKNYHDVQHLKLVSLGGVVFAGDIKNFGIGKIVAIRYTNPYTKKKELLLGVLADKGGAFENNLYQLDLFEGIFYNKKKFREHIKQYPDTVEAYFLKKKEYEYE